MNVQIAIKAQAHPDLMPLLEQELPRLEALLPEAQQGTPEYGQLIRALTAMYGQLARMLAAACLVMKYPLRQWEWPDSQPLTEVAKAYPMVEATEWYQMQLGAVVMPPSEHRLWLDLEVFKDKIDLPIKDGVTIKNKLTDEDSPIMRRDTIQKMGYTFGCLTALSVAIGVVYLAGAVFSMIFGTTAWAIRGFKIAAGLIGIPLVLWGIVFAVVMGVRHHANASDPEEQDSSPPP